MHAPLSARWLQAGPLRALWQPRETLLRYLTFGSTEILRGLYVAVRDANWGTVPVTLHNHTITETDDTFTITADLVWDQGQLQYRGALHLEATASGNIHYRFDGRSESTFARNRIGFLVLHPADVAGQPVTVETVEGATEEAAFPERIAPHQPFFDLRALTHEPAPGLRVRVLMEGDTFEMEDQRNWTDASFKTYCTPLGLPFPVEVSPGDEVHQMISVTVSASGRVPVSAKGDDAVVIAPDAEAPVHRLPALGVALPGEDDGSWTPGMATALRALKLAHLRVEFDLAADPAPMLARAADAARQLGVALEMVLWCHDDPDTEIAAFLDVWKGSGASPVARWLIFRHGEKSTRATTMEAARRAFTAADVEGPLFGGTDAFFTELNRERPPAALIDGVVYSTNPQVHACDEASLVETLAMQGECVRNALTYAPGKPVVVSPITLKMRWNPNATGAPPPTPASELPAEADPRQLSPFARAWTLGSLKYQAEAGAQALTFFRTTGYTGVMERAAGSPLPDKFSSAPGTPYPLYEALLAVAPYAGGEVVPMSSSAPLKVVALRVRRDGAQATIVANLTDASITFSLPDGDHKGSHSLAPYGLQILDTLNP